MIHKRIVVLILLLGVLVGCGALVVWFRNHGFSAREQALLD